MDDRCRTAQLRQRKCRLEPEQPAADHRSARSGARRGGDLGAVLGGAEHVHAGGVDVAEWRDERVRARAENGAREPNRTAAVRERRGPVIRIECFDARVREDLDVVILVPAVGPKPQAVRICVGVEQHPEPYPVIRHVPLAADERQRHVEVTSPHGLAHRLASDPAADDEDPLLGAWHQTASAARLGKRLVSSEPRTYQNQVSPPSATYAARNTHNAGTDQVA